MKTSKAGEKWYIYSNKKTGMQLRFSKRQYFLWMEGYNLISVVDTYVDEKKMKVGGK